MSAVPTKGETFSQLIDHLRQAQEQAATLGHLSYLNDERALGNAWLKVSELLRQTQHQITSLATKGLQ